MKLVSLYLEKIQLKEAYHNMLESFFSGKVVPRHIELLAQDGGKADSAVDYNEKEEEEAEMMSVVHRIVQSCSVHLGNVLLNVVLVYCALLDNISNVLTCNLLE